MHADGNPHSSDQVETGEAIRWSGDLIRDPEVQIAAKACRLVDLATSAIHSTTLLDVTEIRKKLSQVRQSEHDKYRWLKSLSSYRVCVSCMVELPTEVLSCGHIICAMCAKEEVETRPPKMIIQLTCPVCRSSAKWYPKDLPPLAGYRVLALDGGGVRGIVELLSLRKIMSCLDMHVEDLFDIIVGTSTGGIIALALTVRTLNEQPKRLPEVIPLFQKFCEEIFSRKMRRVGACIKLLLRLFQFMGLYNTKYKNDILLKRLEEHLGEQSLLLSCVGGPRVIVTSCDGDNNLAPAWFTSYNRTMSKNGSIDVYQQAPGEKKEQAIGMGRVPDNHLFSAKDAAAATSAASTYFQSYEARNRHWIDGGLRFNCPAPIAIKEAETLWPKRRASAIISLGCGRLNYNLDKRQHSDSILQFLKDVVDILTNAELRYHDAVEDLKKLQPDRSECILRLNPDIVVPKGEECALDSASKIPFLIKETETYLENDVGCACVHKAANLLFAALFYLDVEIDQDSLNPKLDILHTRSRAALPGHLKRALTDASRSSTPPFSVTMCNVVGAESEILWEQCGWDQNVMNLPVRLIHLPSFRPLTVMVKLHMCLPGTTAPEEWPLPISGMPCSLGAAETGTTRSNANG